MKKNLKGFTLVECLVALAILGIASMVMAQIYAGVSRSNRMNHLANTSLSNQVTYAEGYSTAVGYVGNFEGDTTKDAVNPPHTSTAPVDYTKKQYVTITKAQVDAATGALTPVADSTYSHNVDLRVVYAIDQNGDPIAVSSTDVNTDTEDMHYRYLVSK